MKFAHFFIDRPRFATVISTIIVILGAIAYFALPVSQYPEIAPPQIQVIANYPGATSETIAATVASPLEQEINGVENMIYMFSQSTSDGVMTLNILFETGTDLDVAQVMVQNRVAVAEARLPEEVRRRGILTKKSSPDMLMVINLYSPDSSYDETFMSNYASININDHLRRIDGVGGVQVYGGSEYSMRIWLDPDKLSALNLTAGDVMKALRAENIQVASGALNRSPVPVQNAFELTVQTKGRLVEEKEFQDIIIKSGEKGRLIRLKDVARVELAAENYATKSYLGKIPSVVIIVEQRSGANALNTANNVLERMDDLAKTFPTDLKQKVLYNPTNYVRDSVFQIIMTLLITMALVAAVIIAFLQCWRTALIPIIAIPISLMGTLGVMLLCGFSLNMLSLFGFILAIGIVVDDAIVVVENIETKLKKGMEIKLATKQTMNEVGSALVATTLVLVAVFLPTVLLTDLSGQFYKQFGITIAIATMFSTLVSLTLSPAMAAIFMKNMNNEGSKGLFSGPARLFNFLMDKLSLKYSFFVSKIIRRVFIMVIIYVGLIALTGFQFSKIKKGFIPVQDQGYFITVVQLAPGASLDRTDTVLRKVNDAILSIDDIEDTVAFTGYSAMTSTIASNAGAIFSVLKSSSKRREVDAILQDVYIKTMPIDEAFVLSIPPPPVHGIGNAGGFKLMIQDRNGKGLVELEKITKQIAMKANQSAEVGQVFTLFENNTPRVYLDIDRERVRKLGIPIGNVFEALELNLGSGYANDFNFLGRTFRVTVQADSDYRLSKDDIMSLRVRSSKGEMVPIGSIATVKDTSGPSRVLRYNLYPAAAITGVTMPGFSSGQALDRMEKIASEILPAGFGYEWTELAYQEKKGSNMAAMIFCFAVLFVFLVLTAQYESWTLPLAIILIVPMCLLAGSLGLIIAGLDNNILTQIGFVVLVGLACKNAILIVEFSKQNEDQQGMDPRQAAIAACKTRLRPILMTAFSFILGVLPLLFATGSGFEMRRAIGITVFSGMLGVTLFGLIFTPVFYVICRKIALKGETK